MYIGSSRQCREFCRQSGKGAYESAHAKQKHNILDLKSFKDGNRDYILRVQRAWQPFDRDLQAFFQTLREEIDWIEKDAKARLLDEELRTAANSNDRRFIDLSRSIFNEKFERITCKEVEEFLNIKERQEGSRSFLRIQKREEDFALDLIDDIKKAVNSIGKTLTETKSRERERQRQGNTPKQAPSAKRQSRNDPKRETYSREEKPQRLQNKRIEKKQQERQPRRQNRKRDENTENIRKPEREQRQPRRQAKKEDNNYETRKPERQYRQNGRREEGAREGRRPDRETRQNTERGPKQSKTYRKLKIIDLTSSSDEFSIDVRFISLLKNLKDRDVWKVGDGSGEIKLIIPEHESFKIGTNLTLNNCFVRAHGEELQIVTKLYSTITSSEIGNNVDVGSLLKNNPHRNRENKDKVGGQTFKNFTKVGELEPGLQGIKLIAKVVSVKTTKNSIECVLGDETGVVNGRFDSGDQFLKIDNTVYFRDVETEITGDSEGTIVLVPGKRMLIENARDHIKRVKTDNNISLRVYQAYDD